MQVWTVLRAARWKYVGCKNDAKNRHLHTIAQIFRAISSQLRQVSTTRKKLLNSNISPIWSHNMANLRPTSGWDRFGSLGYPCKFQLVLHLGFVIAATSFTGGQPNFAWCLAVSWAATLYIRWSDVTYLWSQCDRHFVGQHVGLFVVKWWRFVALFE